MRLSNKISFAIWLLANLTVCTYAVADNTTHTVVIIDASDSDSPFSSRIRQHIHATIDNEFKLPYSIFSENMDLTRFNGPAYLAAFDEYFKKKYQDKSISVIVALGGESLRYLLRTHLEKLQEIPTVFLSFADMSATNVPLKSNVTGIIARRNFKYLLKSAQSIVPQLAKIVLVGESFTFQPFRQQYQEELEQLSKDINIINLTGLPLDSVKLRVASLPDDAAIAYIPIYNDITGTVHNPREGLNAITDVANRPIVVDAESLVGTGAAGGYVVSAEKIGRELGKRVAQILNGQSASSIPITVEDFNEPVFDFRQLKRWRINADSLPVGSKLLYHEPSVWEQYRLQLLATALIIVIQCLAIILLFIERRRRHVAEREAHQHLLEVAQLDRATTASAISSSIAHELKQPLGAILSNAEAAEMLLDATSPDRDQLKEILVDIQRDDHRAVEIIEHLRKLLKQTELSADLVDLAEVVNDVLLIIKPQAAENDVTIDFASVPSNLWVKADPIHLQQVLLNLAMNAIDAMANTTKNNRRLTLRLDMENQDVVISVEDTGTGIPNDELKNIFKPFVTTKMQGTGLGLSIAQTIIGTYGGVIWAENRPGGGAAFRFKLNLAQKQAA